MNEWIPDHPWLLLEIWMVNYVAAWVFATGYYLFNDLVEAGVYGRLRRKLKEWL